MALDQILGGTDAAQGGKEAKPAQPVVEAHAVCLDGVDAVVNQQTQYAHTGCNLHDADKAVGVQEAGVVTGGVHNDFGGGIEQQEHSCGVAIGAAVSLGKISPLAEEGQQHIADDEHYYESEKEEEQDLEFPTVIREFDDDYVSTNIEKCNSDIELDNG